MEYHTHWIHVWDIYLHLVDFFMVNVGKYTIHGSYGILDLHATMGIMELCFRRCSFVHIPFNTFFAQL